ncbi:PAS domain S-box protein [Pseudohongiella sp. O18]|uniref:PAS domain S-box protein n=1 Tax=Pseudohongiella sp. O18 TaxID=2904248 RepID=UPI001F2CAD3B|nr:PAS domain S-box protein [Pseudohongiella sp. O18]
MQKPAIPCNEPERLKALHSLRLLFTAAEARFDRITRLAQRVFGVEIALISLVAEDIQWFKSRQGLDVTQTERSISFCGHTILQDEFLVVSDTHEDPRFRDNPLVTDAPNIRFYAGAPLKSFDDQNIGTLCLIHPQPRTFTSQDKLLLRDLADLVEQEFQQNHLRDQLLRAERAEQRLASFIQGTNIGTWEWNVQTGETVFNERWANIVGYTLEELAPVSIETWMNLAHPDDLQHSGQALEAHFAGKSDFYDFVCRMKHKLGHWVWVHDRGKLISRNANGEPLMMTGTHADITKQIEAQQALSISEARLRGLFELSPLGIALNDFETGTFIDVNPALIAPTGYSEEEFRQLSYWEVTPEEYAEQEQIQLQKMEETGRYGPYEKEYIRKDGSRYPVLLNGMVVKDANGQKLIWSIIEDISDRKRLDRMKNEFISTVSHELRTPLTAIHGALKLMASGSLGSSDGPFNDMVTIAEKNSQRLLLLINDLLDMEQMLLGKLSINLQWQELKPLIEASIRENMPYARQYQVQLRCIDDIGDLEVMVDSTRLMQVMANLLSNAIKFSPAQGEVLVRVENQEHGIRIKVIDEGPGIPEEFKERIFQKFSQADSTDSRQKGGTGLGLAITRELVDKMGGQIGFSSSVNQGSCFYVDLPTRTSGRQEI